MTAATRIIKLKKGRLSFSTDELQKQFGNDTGIIVAMRLERIILLGKLDYNQAPGEASSLLLSKIGVDSEARPEVHTLNGGQVSFPRKWIEDAGWREGDLIVCVTKEEDPEMMAIEFVEPEALLLPTVQRWIGSGASSLEVNL